MSCFFLHRPLLENTRRNAKAHSTILTNSEGILEGQTRKSQSLKMWQQVTKVVMTGRRKIAFLLKRMRKLRIILLLLIDHTIYLLVLLCMWPKDKKMKHSSIPCMVLKICLNCPPMINYHLKKY